MAARDDRAERLAQIVDYLHAPDDIPSLTGAATPATCGRHSARGGIGGITLPRWSSTNLKPARSVSEATFRFTLQPLANGREFHGWKNMRSNVAEIFWMVHEAGVHADLTSKEEIIDAQAHDAQHDKATQEARRSCRRPPVDDPW